MKTELGGDRLGSGNKQEISLRNYERSSHDLGYIWRSTMASGTLVPFMSEVALPGDSFDIKLDCDVKTLPTIGPLFGSYKVQLDVFQCPVRLYQGKLHMNMLNIGMDMSEVLLPQIKMTLPVGYEYDAEKGDNQQINSSSIYSYLNMRGLGRPVEWGPAAPTRYFNAIPLLGYWDIYKNYYANKQEEEGVVIHADDTINDWELSYCTLTISGVTSGSISYNLFQEPAIDFSLENGVYPVCNLETRWIYRGSGVPYGRPQLDRPETEFFVLVGGNVSYAFGELYNNVEYTSIYDGDDYQYVVKGSNQVQIIGETDMAAEFEIVTPNDTPAGQAPPMLKRFDLDNIDSMRMDILEAVRQTTAFEVTEESPAPYGLGLSSTSTARYFQSNQEGLGIKTYQSDLFNNWISTEWIDGENGINAVTAVSTEGGEFSIDALNLANKVYNMLNRIAISGGSYDDWLDAVYTHERAKSCENPVYHGSLIKELAFEEVISNSASEQGGEEQVLGTLAGRGRLTGKNKGGKIKIKVDEPSYIMGLVSITPRVDYSQGNKWDVNLKTMNDLHKPALDQIGFQDLITDQMAWFDTKLPDTGVVDYSSAGKQPAWINYMTNVNQARGFFAEEDNSMFMTLNRKYEATEGGIGDLTTYVDPSKFNNIFAEEELTAQNFWVQIGLDIFARRKMSAKVIPNL